MNAAQRMRMGLLLAKIKMGNIFTVDWQKDPNPDNWRTINGSKVHLENGKIDGGAGGKFTGSYWKGKVPHTPKAGGVSAVTKQAGKVGASEAQTTAKATAAGKAASAGAAGAKSAITTLAEHMAKKKGAAAPVAAAPAPPEPKDKYKAKAKELWGQAEYVTSTEAFYKNQGFSDEEIQQINASAKKGGKEAIINTVADLLKKKDNVPTPFDDPVPFGSPDPAPIAPAAGAPKGFINAMQGKYKHAPKEIQEMVNDYLKKGDPDWLPGSVEDQHLEVCQKAYNAWKNKEITKLAAQNVIATAATQPGNLYLQKATELWGDSPAPAPKATKPKATTTKTQTTKTTNQFIAAGIVTQMEMATSKEEQKNILKAAGLTDGQATVVMFDYKMDNLNGSNDAPKTLAKILDNNSGAKAPTAKVDYKAEAEKIIEKMDNTVGSIATKNILLQAGLTQVEADDVMEDYDMDGINGSNEAAKSLEKILAKKGGAKASTPAVTPTKTAAPKSDPHETLKTEGPKAKAAGLLQTPNTCAFDFSGSGLKIKKDTILPFAAESKAGGIKILDPCIDNFQKQYDDPDLFKLTSAQKTAINRYKGGSGHLRDYLIYGQVRPGFTKSEIEKRVKDISAGLKKMKHPDMVVTRGCSLMDWATPNNKSGVSFADLQDMAQTGKTFTYEGFLSTGIGDTKSYGDSQVIRHIHVPKKAKGGMINRTGYNFMDDEYEFLLDKKTNFRIMKVEKDKNGVIHVYEEVVP